MAALASLFDWLAQNFVTADRTIPQTPSDAALFQQSEAFELSRWVEQGARSLERSRPNRRRTRPNSRSALLPVERSECTKQSPTYALAARLDKNNQTHSYCRSFPGDLVAVRKDELHERVAGVAPTDRCGTHPGTNARSAGP